MLIRSMVTVLLSAVALMPSGAYRAQTQPPQISLDVGNHAYLSTERVSGRLTIVNTSDGDIKFWSVDYVIRNPDGSETREPRLRTITRVVEPITIPAGHRYSQSVDLPRCEVTSDPCSMQVRAVVRLGIGTGSSSVEIRSNSVSYVLRPDPTATYEIDGLAGSRPIFLVEGRARAAYVRDAAILNYSVSDSAPSDSPSAQDEMRRIEQLFSHYRLPAASVTVHESGQTRWSFEFSHVLGQIAQLDAAQAVILEQFHNLRFVGRAFGISDEEFAFGSTVTDASFAAEALAARLAPLVGSASVAPARGGVGSDSAIRTVGDVSYAADRPWLATFPTSLSASPAEAMNEGLIDSQPGGLLLEARSDDGYIGDATSQAIGEALADAARASAYVGRDLRGLQPTPQWVTVAADRPELFIIGAARENDADALGFRPVALAFASAAEAAREFARDLGVHVNAASLLDEYPLIEDDPREQAVGAAFPLTDEDNAVWRRLAMPTTVPAAVLRSGLAGPTVLPTPIATPTRTPPSPSLSSNVTPRPDLVPIEVPQTQTLITGEAERGTDVPADRSRVGIVVALRQRSGTMPSGGAVVAMLQAERNVIAAHSIPSQNGNPLEAAYEVQVRGIVGNAGAARLRDIVRRAYAFFAPRVVSAQTYGVLDCAALETRARDASVKVATEDAVEQSMRTGRPLRRLLLAAAYPPSFDEGACPGELGNPYNEILNRGSAATLPNSRARVHVRLVFRTFAHA